MKLTIALLFVAFAAGLKVSWDTIKETIVGLNIKPIVTKSDSVYFTPSDQLKTLQQFDAQIEQLRKQQMELILLLIIEPVDLKLYNLMVRNLKPLR